MIIKYTKSEVNLALCLVRYGLEKLCDPSASIHPANTVAALDRAMIAAEKVRTIKITERDRTVTLTIGKEKFPFATD